jgi:hypothetical protein
LENIANIRVPVHRGDRETRAHSLRVCATRQCDCGSGGGDLPGCGALCCGRRAW